MRARETEKTPLRRGTFSVPRAYGVVTCLVRVRVRVRLRLRVRLRVSLEAAFLEHEGSDARGRVGATHAGARPDCGGWRFLLLSSKALAGDARQLLYLVRVRVRAGVGVGARARIRVRVRVSSSAFVPSAVARGRGGGVSPVSRGPSPLVPRPGAMGSPALSSVRLRPRP